MGRFTQAVNETTVFDGDTITYKLRRLQNKHMVKLSPVLSAVGTEAVLLRTARLADESKDVLLECVSEFKGAKDSDGNALTFEDVLGEAYFLMLIDSILGRLLQVSVMTEVDAKKSDATPPAALLVESAAVTPSPES
jgi:hypothetical protein